MTAFARRLLSLAAIFILAGCNYGRWEGGSGAVPSPAGPQSKGKGTAAIRFFIPRAASSAHLRRNLPANTQSIVVNVLNPDGSAVTPAIAPIVAGTTSGCSSVTGGISCTVSVTVPLGSYLFDVVSYAGSNGTGNVLTQGSASATISASSNAVTVATSNISNYVATNIDGDIQTIAVDHVGGTFNVTGLTTPGTISGTFAVLPQNDLKLVVTAASGNSSMIGQIAYAREIPGAALQYFSTGTATPNANGSESSGADWGIGTGLPACPSATVSDNVAAVQFAGKSFASQDTTTGVGVTGVATLSSALSFVGTSYSFAGSATGPQNGTGSACSNGIYSSPSQSPVAAGPFGVLVVGASEPGQSNVTNGAYGFAFTTLVAPTAATITAQSYDGFYAGYNNNGNTKAGAPVVATASAGALQLCPYATFEANQPASTDCATLAFNTSQPVPGLLLATLLSSPTPDSAPIPQPVVVTASQVGGEWVIFGLTQGGSQFALIQH